MSSANFVLLLTVCIVLLTGCLAQPTSRILGGQETDTSSYSYTVSVRLNGAHVCGGSIIGIRHILTSAHCVAELGTTPVSVGLVTVRAGSSNQYAGGKLYYVAEININSEYTSFLNDVAVLTLSSDLVLGERVTIIPLADADAVAPGDVVSVVGWGNTVSEGTHAVKLNHGSAKALSQDECEEEIYYGYPSTLCLQSDAGQGSCFGDAGGPVVFNGVLVGVINFVIGGCGTGLPEVSARVSYFRNWIDSIVNN